MILENIKFDKALNLAYFRQSLLRVDIELFKINFKRLFERINDNETEEHNKNIIADFLKNTFYKDENEINTSGLKDLVIHHENSSQSPVAIIIEAKSPSNKSEMISFEKPNSKALHETIHYFLNERIYKKNTQLKHIIITNIYEWFIFDATIFENIFYDNKNFRVQYQNWADKKLSGTTTDWFYSEIAKPFVENETENLSCVHFNLKNYFEIITNKDIENENKLINLYKIFSPKHLLKLPFANDYNQIDNDFYNELLHILGLEEILQNGLKLIVRKKQNERFQGSLLENAIGMIENLHRTKQIDNIDRFGETEEEQLFSIGLELIITWLNRILFLKLLEAQLTKYHKGDLNYEFLNINKVQDFDEINELFFEVIAKKQESRSVSVKDKFGNLPYLNSSLFEATELEEKALYISQLKDRLGLQISNFTVLKDQNGIKKKGNLNTLSYLFEFLNAYSFASDSTAEIESNSRTIINAAVLGLIFEKINGYKDGSFYTPSFITTFMSRETLKNTLITNFSKAYSKKIYDFEELKELIDYSDLKDRQKANAVFNALKIVDPAVGSGHFLVSVLNELVALKSELKILQDDKFTRLKGIIIQNINDELVIINEETSEPFQYYVNDKHIPPSELQRIQQTLFNEKRILIENCLFGVDINPKSVLICRLRLWIELLKNAFYTHQSDYKYLETLPNIDINIKAGNSLISKFDKGLNIFERASVNKLIVQYKIITDQYKIETDYETKYTIRKTIQNIKSDLQKYAIPRDKYYRKYIKNKRELEALFDIKPKSESFQKEITRLSLETDELEKKYKQNYYYVYSNALEWAIDFPEILSENGEFIGFDIVLGNPPYFSISNDSKLKEVNENYTTYKQSGDIYMLFIEKGMQILKPEGRLSMITSNKWLRAAYGDLLRDFLLSSTKPELLVDLGGVKVFDQASVDTSIVFLSNEKITKPAFDAVTIPKNFNTVKDSLFYYAENKRTLLSDLNSESWNVATETTKKLLAKIKSKGVLLEDWDNRIKYGIKNGFNKAFFIDGKTKAKLIAQDPKSAKIIVPFLRGRDVHKYYIDKQDQFLINTYNGKLVDKINPKTGKKQKIRVERVEVEKNYPAIYQHLLLYKEDLEKRTDKGEHWTNQRNCAYQHLFYSEKIIFPETTGRRSEFYFDNKNYLVDKTCFILTGNNLKYILGILTSKVMAYYFESIGRTLGKSAIQYSKQYMDKLPIPKITEKNQKNVTLIENLIDEITALKDTNPETDISNQIKKLDNLVYILYDLSKSEIELVESLEEELI